MPALSTVKYIAGYGNPYRFPSSTVQVDSVAASNDGYVVKYNTSGTAQWAARITSSSANEIAFGIVSDANGNTYVTGQFQTQCTFYSSDGTTFQTIIGGVGNDVFIAKYNSNGIGQWAARLSSSGTDIGYAVAVDSSGSAYVTGVYTTGTLTAFNTDGSAFGTTLANAGTQDAFVAKYNTNGAVQWLTRISTAGADIGYDISIDSSSNIYVTGQYTGGAIIYNADGSIFGTLANAGSQDAYIVKYNSSGVVQWTARVAFTGIDIGWAITTDSTGNIYVGGQGSGGSGVTVTAYNSDTTAFSRTIGNLGAGDTWVTKYNSSGFVQWIAQIGSGAADSLFDMATDPSGNLYVCGASPAPTVYNSDGTTFGTIAAIGNGDAWLVKYDSSGFGVWTTRVGTSLTTTDIGYSVACDSSGNVYFTGQVGTNATSFNVYNSTAAGGGLVTTIQTINAGSNDSFLVKYNSGGTVQWATKLASSGVDAGRSISVDSYGNVYTCGVFAGTRLSFYGQAVSLFATVPNAGNRDSFIIKYNANGGPQWIARIAGTAYDEPYGTASDSLGGIYVTGIYTSTTLTIYNSDGTTFGTLSNSGGFDAYIVKYNSTGTAQWATRIASSGDDFGLSICSDVNSNIIVTGYNAGVATVYNSDGTSFGSTLAHVSGGDGFVVKYNSSGFVQWITRVSATGFDGIYGSSTDSSGSIIVTGQYAGSSLTVFSSDGSTFGTLTNSGGSDVCIIEYNSSGIVQWTARIASTGADIGFATATDSSGNVYIAGQYTAATITIFNANGTSFGTLANLGQNDGFVVKYNSSGAVQWTTRFGSTSFDSGYGIVADSSGNVYVTGFYNAATVTIYNAGGTTFGTLTNSGAEDAFVIKYNTNGAVQWAIPIRSTSKEIGFGIGVDSNQNVYISGVFGGSDVILTLTNLDGSSFASASGTGYAVVKFDKNGTGQWIQRIGGIAECRGVTISYTGDCYVVGSSAAGTALKVYNIDNTPYKFLNMVYGTDIYLLKQNSNATPQWAAVVSAADSTEISYSLITDSSGNIYITGYGGTTTITVYNADGTTFGQLTTPAGRNAFIIKYNSDGVVQWATRGIGGDTQNTGLGIVVDSTGNVYVTGQFGSTSTIYNANGTTFGTLTTTGSFDVYTIKYNSSGIAQWAASMISSNSSGRGISVDSSGNIFVVGQYSGASISIRNSDGTTFGTLANTDTTLGTSEGFVVEYNSSGFAQWAARITGSTTTNDDFAWATATDSGGNVYVGGLYYGTLTVRNASGTTFGTLAAIGNGDAFLIKYNSSGVVQWATRFGGTSSGDIIYGIGVDSANNVIVTGGFAGTATVYNSSGTSFGNLVAPGSTSAVFVVKYDSSGTVQWAAKANSLPAPSDTAYGIAVDSAGAIYITGQYNGTFSVYNSDGTFFGSTTATPGTTYSFESFVLKYNSAGSVQWISGASGANANRARSIAVDSTGNIFSTGTFATSALIPFNA